MKIFLEVNVYLSKLLKEIFPNKALRGILLGMTSDANQNGKILWA